MPIAGMKTMLQEARRTRMAVGAFEFWSLDSAQAVVEAAEEAGTPVILQAGSIECAFAGMKNLVEAARRTAEAASVPVALHLDHAERIDLVRAAIDAGFTSVMIDASGRPFDENVAMTRQVVAMAAAAGVDVEAELGRLPGTEGGAVTEEGDDALTDPDEAARFVRETGIDALAVSIGTRHGFYRSTPRIDLDRLARIADRVSLPLVLHGGSGTPPDKIVAAIALGIAKVNICTEFIAAFGRSYCDEQARDGFRYSVPALFGPAKEAGRRLALSRIRLFQGRT